MYVFSGHPQNIASISDSFVRFNSFFDRTDIQILRFQKYDELFFWSPSTPEMFIWNYRDLTWQRRSITQPVSGTVSPKNLTFATASQAYTIDSDTFVDVDGDPYNSFVERKQFTITPEFTTEYLNSIAFLIEGSGALDVSVRGSNLPSDLADIPTNDTMNTTQSTFNIEGTGNTETDYKADTRIHGRFLNYRFGATASDQWALSGFQFELKGGGVG